VRNGIAGFQRKFEAICRLAAKGEVASALREIDVQLDYWRGNAQLHKQQAILIQLLNQAPVPPLSNVKNALQAALALEPESAACHNEMGFYLLNVEDDAAAAQPFFDRAVELCTQQLKEARKGRAEAVRERRTVPAQKEQPASRLKWKATAKKQVGSHLNNLTRQ
jgi:hypothetical protein